TVHTSGEDVSIQSQNFEHSQSHQFDDEDLLRTYIYHVLSPEVTLTSDYSLSKLNEDRLSAAQGYTTHRVTSALNYFHPEGYFATLRATWRQQASSIDVLDDQTSSDKLTSFWLFDANIGYRLPDRYGSLQVSFRNLLNRHFDYQSLPSDGRVLSDDFEAVMS